MTNPNPPERSDAFKSEGDVNFSPHRAAWSREFIDDETGYWLEEDAR